MRLSQLLLAHLLAQGTAVSGQGFTNESEVPYYGFSPPVYPSRRTPPTHPIDYTLLDEN